MSTLPDGFDRIYESVSTELFKNVLPFWQNYSHDEKYGGFFACLGEDGRIYDTQKFMWLNGRQIWTLNKVCSSFSAEELAVLSDNKLSHSRLIEQTLQASNFCLENAFLEGDRPRLAYFALTQEGKGSNYQRKIFSHCFLCLGFGGLYANLPEGDENKTKFGEAAMTILEDIISLIRDPSPFGHTPCPGAPAIAPLNIPMILLNTIDELRISGLITEDNESTYSAHERWSIAEILKHVKPERKQVLENVGLDGEELPGFTGRHMNPGHAIECGWFLLQYAKRINDDTLKATACNVVNWAYEYGWDDEEGGLLYFLDSEGKDPPHLEWNMKLWWPHTEAMVAFALMYQETKEQQYWDRLVEVYDYSVDKFSAWNSSSGQPQEWYGYCDKQGRLTHSFRGGPYKGCFHVPRGLLFVFQVLESLRSLATE